jgi:hypothetical protein
MKKSLPQLNLSGIVEGNPYLDRDEFKFYARLEVLLREAGSKPSRFEAKACLARIAERSLSDYLDACATFANCNRSRLAQVEAKIERTEFDTETALLALALADAKPGEDGFVCPLAIDRAKNQIREAREDLSLDEVVAETLEANL